MIPITFCILDTLQVANLLNEEIPQIYALCGRGPRASLSVLRPGLAVTELAVSPLPGAPTAVWTVRRNATDDFDAFIVVSFANATLVRPGKKKGEGASGRGLKADKNLKELWWNEGGEMEGNGNLWQSDGGGHMRERPRQNA